MGSVEIFFQPSKRITHWHRNYQLLHPGSPFQRQSSAENQQNPLKDGCFDEIWCWEELGVVVSPVFSSVQQQVADGRLLDSVNFQGSLSLNHWLSGAKTSQASDLGKKEVKTWNSWRFHKGLCAERKICSFQSLSSLSFLFQFHCLVFEAVIWFSGSSCQHFLWCLYRV